MLLVHTPNFASKVAGIPMFLFLTVVQAIVAAALVGVILMQRSEGGGLGIGGSVRAGMLSARGAADFLTRATRMAGGGVRGAVDRAGRGGGRASGGADMRWSRRWTATVAADRAQRPAGQRPAGRQPARWRRSPGSRPGRARDRSRKRSARAIGHAARRLLWIERAAAGSICRMRLRRLPMHD